MTILEDLKRRAVLSHPKPLNISVSFVEDGVTLFNPAAIDFLDVSLVLNTCSVTSNRKIDCLLFCDEELIFSERISIRGMLFLIGKLPIRVELDPDIWLALTRLSFR